MVRSPTVVEGTNEYKITASCIEAGTLADKSIFVLTIVNVDDPKDDTLARVSQAADFDEIKADRDAAIAAGEPRFRSPEVILTYTDLETANAAQKELKSRITTLVNNYDDYLDEFSTGAVGEVVTYPTVDESVKNQLIADYEATAKPITDAEDERDDKQDECNLLQTKLEIAQERLTEAESDLNTVTDILSTLTSSTSTLVTLQSDLDSDKSSIRTFNSTSGASSSEKADIEAELTSMDSLLNQFKTENTALDSLESGALTTLQSVLQARVASLTSIVNSRQLELNKCNREVSELQAKVDRARAAQDEALAAVREVCPDYTP